MNRTVRLVALGLLIAFGVVTSALAQRQAPGSGTPPPAPVPSDKALAGRTLFFDTSLSSPRGMSCASCHDPAHGWADARSAIDPVSMPTSEGAVAGRFGARNSLTLTYAHLGPDLFYDAATASYIGGRYRDGSAADAWSQAKLPFLDPLEMNNRTVHEVVLAVKRSAARDPLERIYGKEIWRDHDRAFDAIAECLAELQRLEAMNAFSSRYDRFLKGKGGVLTDTEQAGRMLFLGRGQCTSCHVAVPGPDGRSPLFSNSRYYNLGVPRNPRNPFYDMPASLNPEGRAYVDRGLGGVLGLASEMGKFKVPTLRNVALTGPYMHNGVFSTLTEAVQFHNTRDIDPLWGPPEVPSNVAIGPALLTVHPGFDGRNQEPPGDDGMPSRLGQLGLSQEEVDQVVAFLQTLTDQPTGR